jgi:hypothetical protein
MPKAQQKPIAMARCFVQYKFCFFLGNCISLSFIDFTAKLNAQIAAILIMTPTYAKLIQE